MLCCGWFSLGLLVGDSWGCPISLSTLRIGTASLALMYNAPSSASAAEDMTKTALMSCAMLSTDPLLLGSFVPHGMEKCPLAQLQAFGLLRYDALLWMTKTMLLAW